MDQIFDKLANNPDLGFAATAVVAFGAAVCLVLGIRYLFASRTDVVRERLHRFSSSTGAHPAQTEGGRGSIGLFGQMMQPISKIATPTDEDEMSRLRARLSHAGFRGESDMVVFLGIKVILAVLLGLAFIWFNSRRPQELHNAALFGLSAVAAGFYLPNLWLSSRISERQKSINHALADTLDLMVTCLEAGLGLEAALNRVATETQLSSPLFSRELGQIALEMRAGVTRGEAFKRLAARTGVEELRNLAAIIMQTQIFGTSIARSLRVMAESIRIRRMQKAEEKAATVGVKMVVPLILCILPSLFCVLMGPAAVSIVRTLLPTLGAK